MKKLLLFLCVHSLSLSMELAFPEQESAECINDQSYTCFVCDIEYPCLEDYLLHEKSGSHKTRYVIEQNNMINPIKVNPILPLPEPEISQETSCAYQKKIIEIAKKMKTCPYEGCKKKLAGSLVNHMRTHTNEKPYGCGVCSYSSSQKENCCRHIRAMHLSRNIKAELIITIIKKGKKIIEREKVAKQVLTCKSCDKKFYGKPAYSRHKAASKCRDFQ